MKMVIKREIELSEDEVKDAIRQYLDYEVENSDDLVVNFEFLGTPGDEDFIFTAVCNEEYATQ